MLYETTLVVEQVNREHEALGLDDAKQIKYLPLQLNIGDIKYHHGYQHETDDGEFIEGTIIRYHDGDMVATLADFEEIAELRRQFEKQFEVKITDYRLGEDDESND